MFNKNLMEACKPHKCNTIDEQLIPFWGATQSLAKIYIIQTAKYGIKIFRTCDAATIEFYANS